MFDLTETDRLARVLWHLLQHKVELCLLGGLGVWLRLRLVCTRVMITSCFREDIYDFY